MNHWMSFFRSQEDTGQEFRTQFTVQSGKVELYIYCKRPPEKKLVNEIVDRSVEATDALKGHISRIQEIVSQSGGGVLVERQPDGKQVVIQLVSGDRISTPLTAVLMLRPGFPPRYLPVDSEANLPMHPYLHLLVPVDSEAQTQLQVFLEHLRWVSPDLEALVLNHISQPSLESRIDRLEKRSGSESPQHSASTSHQSQSFLLQRSFSRVGQWFTKPLYPNSILAGSLLAALLLSVSVNGWMLRPQSSLPPAESQEEPIGSSTPTQTPEASSQPPLAPATPHGETPAVEPDTAPSEGDGSENLEATGKEILGSARGLLDVVASFPAGSDEKVLYSSHFESLHGQAEIFTKESSYGWVKLLALLQSRSVQEGVLKNTSEKSSAKALLREMSPDLKEDEKLLLAHITCTAFPENRDLDRAGFPKARLTDPERVDIAQPCSLSPTDLYDAHQTLANLQALALQRKAKADADAKAEAADRKQES